MRGVGVTCHRLVAKVAESENLADNRVRELEELLAEKAAEATGMQMVVQLTSDTQEFLAKHNHKPMSAYEAMQHKRQAEVEAVRCGVMWCDVVRCARRA